MPGRTPVDFSSGFCFVVASEACVRVSPVETGLQNREFLVWPHDAPAAYFIQSSQAAFAQLPFLVDAADADAR